jgi:uncharacterized membrane-anchored protein
MRQQGVAKLDKRTKDLVKRLTAADVAIVDHADMDRVSAEGLVASGVEVVVNAAASISGTYPNVGPLILARGGVTLIDDVGVGIFDAVKEGDVVEVVGGEVIRNGQVVASGERLSVAVIEDRLEAAKAGLGEQLDKFARNTIEYLDEERGLLTDELWIPETKVSIYGRHVLVVVRGYDYLQDLEALKAYIRDVRPVLIGVDGGADALLEEGFKPDIIIGDMDSVSDDALRGASDIIVHAYADGRTLGLDRVEKLGLPSQTWPLAGTSEDLALLLAWEAGADLIVAVGTHANLVEFLDKGRGGMASTFLVRLKVGPRLVDAKGVSKLYRSTAGAMEMLVLVGAALVVVSALFVISPTARYALELLMLRLRAWFGV